MKKMLIGFVILAAAVIAISIKIYYDTNVFKVNTVQFQTNKIPEGAEFTVLQISDVHSKVFGDHNEALLHAVDKLNADIIVITGDLIDRKTDDFTDAFTLVENLMTINKEVFFVSGNHEWENTHTEHFIDGLRERNVKILNNRSTQITINHVTLNLIGVDDVSTSHENMNEAVHGIDQELYTILLSHAPNIVLEYRDIPSDLILSGHTHGGQVRLPLIGALVAPDQGFFPKLDKGTYTFGPEQYLYIDSGLGTSLAPVRFLNQSQISYIKIANLVDAQNETLAG